MTHLAIFASGQGTNAEAILTYFRESREIKVAVIITNNPAGGITGVARKYGIPLEVITRADFYQTNRLLDTLRTYNIGFIALAGFLWLIPKYLLDAFPGKIINIHPALLPKHGGKGMFGKRVHESVLKSGDKETGITIHYVNEHFDEGEIIFQAKCSVQPADNVASLQAKVRHLEHRYYPKVIEQLLVKETATT